jgi:hypothetical protein
MNCEYTKSIKYNCDDKAKQCSARYSNDLCNNEYSLSLTDLFKYLGLEGLENISEDLFDIDIKQYPNDCDIVSACCLVQTTGCNSEENKLRKQCRESLSNHIICPNLSCPPSGNDYLWPDRNISGNYTIEKEIYEFRIKNHITKDYFLDNHKTIITHNVSGLSNTNTYIYNLDDLNILNTNHINNSILTNQKLVDWHKQTCGFVGSGIYLKYIYSQNSGIELTKEQNLYNELIYRKNIDHPNKINGPFYEYDPSGELPNTIVTQTINFGTKKCLDNNTDLFKIAINKDTILETKLTVEGGWRYITYNLTTDTSGYKGRIGYEQIENIIDYWIRSDVPSIRTTCNTGVLRSNNYNIQTSAVNYNIFLSDYIDVSFFGSGEFKYADVFGCDLAKKTVKPNIEILDCNFREIGQTIETQNCHTPCETSISYIEHEPSQCFCPPGYASTPIEIIDIETPQGIISEPILECLPTQENPPLYDGFWDSAFGNTRPICIGGGDQNFYGWPCNTYSGRTKYPFESNMLTKTNWDIYQSGCPDATSEKEHITYTYDVIGVPTDPKVPPFGGTTSFAKADIKLLKRTNVTKTKNNYNLVYGSGALATKIIHNHGYAHLSLLKSDQNIKCFTSDVFPETDSRECCRKYDLETGYFNSRSNALFIKITQYKDLIELELGVDINYYPLFVAPHAARFCIPITPYDTFTCPKIKLELLNENLFIYDTINSKLSNCPRGIIEI